MSLLNGKPEPRIKLVRGSVLNPTSIVADVLISQDYTLEQNFEPVAIRHELQTREVKSKLKGFRYFAEINFEVLHADTIIALHQLFDVRQYDAVQFYPYATDKPHYWHDVVLDDESIKLGYFYLLANRDFKIKFVSRKLADYVPIELPDFANWGNMSLTFSDMTMRFDSLPDYTGD